MRMWILVLTWSVCTLAQARAPRRIALHYTRDVGAQACIDPVALARRVEAYTGPVLVAPAHAETSLEVHVRGDRRGFSARIQLGGVDQGERELRHASTDCAGFADTLAFVLATTIDPDLVLERVGAMFASEQAPEHALLSELERTPARPAQPRATIELGPIKRVPVRHPPAFVPALSAGVIVSDEPLRIGAGVTATARAVLRQHFAFAIPLRFSSGLGAIRSEQVDVRSTALGLDVLGCVRRPLVARMIASLCLGPTVSALRARGSPDGEAGWAWAAGMQLRPELTTALGSRLALVAAPFVSYLAPQRRVVTATLQTERVLVRSDAFVFGVTLEVLRSF
jgi:hypothetical protein